MQPMLDPKRDLKGATPEALARALLRPRVRRPVVREAELESDRPAPCVNRLAVLGKRE